MDGNGMKQYELFDLEEGKNLKKFQDDVKKEMKKQEKPKTKPTEIFEGFKERKSVKTKVRRSPRFTKKTAGGFAKNTGGTY